MEKQKTGPKLLLSTILNKMTFYCQLFWSNI